MLNSVYLFELIGVAIILLRSTYMYQC